MHFISILHLLHISIIKLSYRVIQQLWCCCIVTAPEGRMDALGNSQKDKQHFCQSQISERVPLYYSLFFFNSSYSFVFFNVHECSIIQGCILWMLINDINISWWRIWMSSQEIEDIHLPEDEMEFPSTDASMALGYLPAIRGPVRINEVLGAPVYTCLFHYFGKAGSKTTNLLSDFSSLTQSTSPIISRAQACPALESHTDTCTGDQGRVSSLPQNPPWAHWNRSRTCINWTISAKCWLRDIARFVR